MCRTTKRQTTHSKPVTHYYHYSFTQSTHVYHAYWHQWIDAVLWHRRIAYQLKCYDYLAVHCFVKSWTHGKDKGKVLPYSSQIVGPGAETGVQVVSPQMAFQAIPSVVGCHYFPPVTFPAEECHRPSTSTKLYCLVTEAHRCEQLVHGCCAALPLVRNEPTT